MGKKQKIRTCRTHFVKIEIHKTLIYSFFLLKLKDVKQVSITHLYFRKHFLKQLGYRTRSHDHQQAFRLGNDLKGGAYKLPKIMNFQQFVII